MPRSSIANPVDAAAQSLRLNTMSGKTPWQGTNRAMVFFLLAQGEEKSNKNPALSWCHQVGRTFISASWIENLSVLKSRITRES